MPRKTNEESLGEAIRRMLETYRLEGKVRQARVINAWEDVTGKMISRHTQDLYIKGSKLFVKLDSPALKNELSYSKGKIIEMLNKEAGGEIIKDIVFS